MADRWAGWVLTRDNHFRYASQPCCSLMRRSPPAAEFIVLDVPFGALLFSRDPS